MPGKLSLAGVWGLTWAEGSPFVNSGYYATPRFDCGKLLEAEVPAPVHRVLERHGLLEDANFGLNSLRARWVEEMFWIYRRTFSAPAEAANQPATLCFGRLELEADVWLNGELVGHHENAHRPAEFDVTGKVQAGENLIVVRVSTGMHSVADKSALEYGTDDISRLTKRHWHRHPQYQHGWDWNARLVNVGILGEVALEWGAAPRLREVAVFAVPSDDYSKATFHARASLMNRSTETTKVLLKARVAETGQEVTLEAEAAPGESRHEMRLELSSPKLWWPIGHGDQALYTVEVTAEASGEVQQVTRRTGVRKVEVDQSAHPVEGQYFTLKVNDRPIFCKGGNWVPPDMLYTSVEPERYQRLVDLAIEANFTMLRVWGGGLFLDESVCSACDEAGLLIWHDLLFACSKYPGDDPAFVAEARREVTYNLRELAHHPSMAVWCGNNEIEWGDWGWGYDNWKSTHPHYALFHRDLPAIAQDEAPHVFYWRSSPYSPNFEHPNDPTVGDQHPWTVTLQMPGGSEWWEYRKFVDRFPNEGGVLGSSPITTLKQFLPEDERSLYSPSWTHHDNPYATMDSIPGAPGHAYQTVTLWTGRDPRDMTLEDYAFTSGLLQADGLREYISNFRRRMFSSASAIFWMYNDSWPVTNGWTIVDYYLRKKLAFHPVRKAFQPVTVVVAEEDGVVKVFGVNDSPDDWFGDLQYGFFTLEGELLVQGELDTKLPALSSTILGELSCAEWEELGARQSGAFAVLRDEGRILAQHRLFVERFHDLEFAEPQVTVLYAGGVATFSSPHFVWGVCLDDTGELAVPDNCFDLLPGIPYTLDWPAELGEPTIVAIGSRDAVKPA